MSSLRVHTLKTEAGPFEALRSRRKTFEYRRDDRPGGFQVGDVLSLREFEEDDGGYSGRALHARVTYVLRGRFGVPEGYAVLSLADGIHMAMEDRPEGCNCGVPREADLR